MAVKARPPRAGAHARLRASSSGSARARGRGGTRATLRGSRWSAEHGRGRPRWCSGSRARTSPQSRAWREGRRSRCTCCGSESSSSSAFPQIHSTLSVYAGYSAEVRRSRVPRVRGLWVRRTTRLPAASWASANFPTFPVSPFTPSFARDKGGVKGRVGKVGKLAGALQAGRVRREGCAPAPPPPPTERRRSAPGRYRGRASSAGGRKAATGLAAQAHRGRPPSHDVGQTVVTVRTLGSGFGSMTGIAASAR